MDIKAIMLTLASQQAQRYFEFFKVRAEKKL